MDIRNLLKELGLMKYEIEAYLKILEQGIAEASTIYKEAKVPFGKIYETLSTLAAKGLIEVQDTRPKKYKAKKPRLAFDSLFQQKKEYMEKNLQKTRAIIIQIGEGIAKINVKQPKEKIFWTTAVGDEVGDLVRSSFEEAEKEIYILVYHKNQLLTSRKQIKERVPFIIEDMIKATLYGVKVKALLSENFTLRHINLLKKFPKKSLKNIDIKIIDEYLPSHFLITDSEKVVLNIDDPTDKNKILATIKIWDIKLAEKLKDKFNEMWEKATPFKST